MNRSIPVVISVLMVSLAACGRKQTFAASTGLWGPTSYSILTPSTGKLPAPGVEQGSVLVGYAHWPGRSEAAFAVWVGAAGGGGCSGFTEPAADSPSQRVCVFKGHVAKIPVECRTADAKSGKIKIGDGTFQLEQGALFLVSTAAEKPVILQLPLSHLNLKGGEHPDLDGLRALAANDPVISAFWKQPPAAK
jgi:hypothetical protein